MMPRNSCAVLLLSQVLCTPLTVSAAAPAPAIDPREVHFADLVQLSRGGENAEAYWSPDGRQLVFQSTRPPYTCDQIFRMPADGSGAPTLVSTGKGRTTCSYFTRDGARILYASTHLAGDACPPPADRSKGYVWAVYPSYEIFSARPDGSDLVRLTDNQAYDAEATVCPKDGSVIFTSDRDGDLDLYRMDADGRNVKRLTSEPGYDGGAFFSPDCSRIVWRAARAKTETEREDARQLLATGLVRPTQLELYVAKADGTEARQVTHLNAASFGPAFFPAGDRIIFSSNYGDSKGREFDLWAINLDGSGLERITWTPGFDGFPLFSPDGTRLAFASNRNQSAPGETNVFVTRWVAGGPGPDAAAARFHDDVAWLADDAREGRGVGTAGLTAARDWLAARFREIGLEPAGEGGGWFQGFTVPWSVEVLPATTVTIDGRPVERQGFQPAGFSASGELGRAEGEVVAAGYGISAPELGIDDYQGIDAKGRIVVVRRFTPKGAPFDKEEVERRFGDLRSKAFTAREHGARALIVVDAPPPGTEEAAEVPLPQPSVEGGAGSATGDAGLPVIHLSRAAGASLFTGAHRAALAIELDRKSVPADNVVGVLRAGAAGRLPGAVLVGAHYDHLGLGGRSSLEPDKHEVHNGADDNASGTAALLEVARLLAGRRAELRRDVWFVAFSGEEEGVIGSTAFTRHPPAGLRIEDLTGMLNMDMVGRLRNRRLSVLGGDSATEWKELVAPVCAKANLVCTTEGDGYGASDQTPFYAAGVPVLHFFTGTHADYHKTSDDTDKIEAAGGAEVAGVVAEVALAVADRPERLAYKSVPAPGPKGDPRSAGASLGTVPDYAGDGRAGVLLAGVRPGSAAEKGGLQRGDLLVELAGSTIRDVHDLMYVLRRAKAGEVAKAVVDRAGQRVELQVTFEASRGMR